MKLFRKYTITDWILTHISWIKNCGGKLLPGVIRKKLCDPSLPDLININALETVLVIVLIIPLAVIDGLFNTNPD